MIPEDADICVCTDLDEVFNKEWRKELEEIWTPITDRVRYNLNFTFDNNNNPVSSYFISKIHTRNNYKWTHPIHEVITFTANKEENIITSDKIIINHYPDRKKDRSFYLKLLEKSVEENPLDDRNMHYLGREYMYNKEWNKSIDTLIKHLYLKSSTWNEERSASMRFISRCYIELKRYDEAEMWLNKAIKETPNIREPYIEMGLLFYKILNYELAIKYIEKGLDIKEKSPIYINEEFAWNETPYDILSICYFNLKNKEKSIENVLKALEINNFSDRLKNNYYIIKNS